MLDAFKVLRKRKERRQAQRAICLAKHKFYPLTILFSGGAGAGKSYMINHILRNVYRNWYPNQDPLNVTEKFSPAEESGNFLRSGSLYDGEPILDFRADPRLKIRYFMALTNKRPDWLYKTPKHVAFKLVLFDGWMHFNTYVQNVRPKTVRRSLTTEDFYHRMDLLVHVYWSCNQSSDYRYARIYHIRYVKKPQLIDICHEDPNADELYWTKGIHLSHYVPFPTPSVVEPLDRQYVRRQCMAIQLPMEELEDKMRKYPPLLTAHQATQVLSRYIIDCNKDNKLIRRMWRSYHK